MNVNRLKLEIVCSRCAHFDNNKRTLCGQGRRCIVMCRGEDGLTLTLPDCHTDKYNKFRDGIL